MRGQPALNVAFPSAAGLLVKASAATVFHALFYCTPAGRGGGGGGATLPFRHGAEGCDYPVRYVLRQSLRFASAFTSSNVYWKKKTQKTVLGKVSLAGPSTALFLAVTRVT